MGKVGRILGGIAATGLLFLGACSSSTPKQVLPDAGPGINPQGYRVASDGVMTTDIYTYQINGTVVICLIWTTNTGDLSSSCDWSQK